MSICLTLKSIPDELYERLDASAQPRRRSLDSETLACMRSVPMRGSAARERCGERATREDACAARGVAEGEIPGESHRCVQARRPGAIAVDANVVAYSCLSGDPPGKAEARLGRDPAWAAPVLWRSGFRNVAAGCTRRNARALGVKLACMNARLVKAFSGRAVALFAG